MSGFDIGKLKSTSTFQQGSGESVCASNPNKTSEIDVFTEAKTSKSTVKSTTVPELPQASKPNLLDKVASWLGGNNSPSLVSNLNITASTPLAGDVKTGAAANEIISKMSNAESAEISVVSDEIRELAKKENKSPAEVEQLKTEIKIGMQKLGNSYTKFLDSKYGDGSGKISEESFLKFQSDGLKGLSAEQMAELEKSNKTMFNRLDLNKDGKLDNEEMSAYFFAMDFNENNAPNGAIDTNSMIRNAPYLDDANKNVFDAKLKYAYGELYGKQVVE